MENISRKCIWIALKIWFFAILLNTLAGTIILSGPAVFEPFIALIGAYWGIVYSSPIFIIFIAILIFLVRREASFKNILFILIVAGIILTVTDLTLFFNSFGPNMGEMILYLVACCSTTMAIIFQIKWLKKLTVYKNGVDELLKLEK